MSVYKLQNQTISIEVESLGAELKSLQKRSTGAEYLWCGDARYWGRTSPVLFPFVGGLNHKEYRTKGKTYPMTQHGFARDMEFTVVSQTEEELWMKLESGEETMEKYPYQFLLKLGYRLLEQGVEVLWQVENPGEEEMFFSIGGHPAFNCPMGEGEAQTDYLLAIGAGEKGALKQIACTRLSDSGLATEREDVYPLQNGMLPVTEHLFDRDALVVEHNQAHTVALCRKDGAPYLTVKMEAPLFGIWSPPKKNAPFICIEPWYGRCDQEGFGGELREKKWVNRLAPGACFQAAYQILV